MTQSGRHVIGMFRNATLRQYGLLSSSNSGSGAIEAAVAAPIREQGATFKLLPSGFNYEDKSARPVLIIGVARVHRVE